MNAFWAAFLTPFALLLILSLITHLRFPASDTLTAVTRGRIVVFFVAGLVLAIWCAARLPALMNDNARYFTDPSCTSGTATAVPRAGDACRSETVGIAAARISSGGRSGTHYYMTLVRANGARTDIEVRTSADNPVWQAAAANPGLVAHLQLFRGRPVLLGTDQGLLPTKAFPTDVLGAYRLWLVFGAGMVAAAILDLIYSWRTLF